MFDCLLDISFHIFNNVPSRDINRSYVIDQLQSVMPIIIFSSKDERLYVDWIACCVDFYNFAVDNIDIKEYTTLFRLKCVFT